MDILKTVIQKFIRPKNQESPCKHIISDNPLFIIEVEPNNDIGIAASWNKPKNQEELSAIIHKFTGLLIIFHKSDIINIFMQAIMVYGRNHGDEETAKSIINAFQGIIKEKYSDTGKPVVAPTAAFRSQ